MKFSPTAAGWRTIIRHPAIAFAEIVWRWIFGLITALTLGFSFLVYLSTIPVPAPALWMMDTRRTALLGGALAQVVHGSGWAATKITLIALPALAMFWIVLASLGRAATLQPMLTSVPEGHGSWTCMLGISFLRFAAWFAANVALSGALIVAAMATTGLEHPVGTALLIFFVLAIVVFSAWSVLNWLLTLASIFVVRDQADTFTSIGSAVDLVRRRFAPLLATSSAWAIVRSAALLAATISGAVALAFLRSVPPGYVLLGVLLITLGYLAVADLLYVSRLASYVAILEADLEPPPVIAPAIALPPEPDPPGDILPFSPQLPASPELPAES
jgi:hypothetical protein